MKDFSFGIVPIVKTYNGVEILLVQHNNKVGHWAFPKGHKEGQEKPMDTAMREFEEETGISSKFLEIENNIFFDTHYRFKLFHKNILIEKTVSYFLAHLSEKFPVVIQEEELLDSSRLSFDAAMEKLTYSVDKEMLKFFMQYF